MARGERNRFEEREEFDESPYLRRQRAISVQRKKIERNKLAIFFRVFFLLLLLGMLAAGGKRFVDFATTSPKFQINIREIQGLRNLSEAAVMEQLSPLIGQNIFHANYSDRIRALMQIPWVQSVTLLRFWPNTVSVLILERDPVGYALIEGTVQLIDREGIPLVTSGDTVQHFDFPVMRGLVAENTTDEHTLNRIRIGRYMDVLKDLETEHEGYSKDLSEVDVAEVDDVKILLKKDPILVHLGKDNYLSRFKLYLANIKRLKQDYPDIDSVDLRFKDQLVIKRQEISKQQPAKPKTE